MGATLTVNETRTLMVRKVGDELVLQEREQKNYITPPKDTYEWEITGYAVPFDMAKNEEWVKEGESKTQTMTRLEFTIIGGPGDGKMFDEMFGYTVGPKANMGRLFRSLNVDLSLREGSWDLDRCIGYRGRSFISHGVDKNGQVKLDDRGRPARAKIALETVIPTGAPAKELSIDLDAAKAKLEASTPAATEPSGSDDGWS